MEKTKTIQIEPTQPKTEVLTSEAVAKLNLSEQRKLVRLMVAGQVVAGLVMRTNRSPESAARDARGYLEALEKELE